MADTPIIQVGISVAKRQIIILDGSYQIVGYHTPFEGRIEITCEAGFLVINGSNGIHRFAELCQLIPSEAEVNRFTIQEVTIGINFHWERKEDQRFKGNLIIRSEGDEVRLINALTIEDYLISVISSEMSATSSLQLLKAHAVTSRSWLLAQIEKSNLLKKSPRPYQSTFASEDRLIRWYDREDHDHFDVCADDHCQRYQGVTRATTPLVEQAVKETWGEVVTYNGQYCDARFSKCCGGVAERFENVWEPVNHPYLQKFVDGPVDPKGFSLDLQNEDSAMKWIDGSPEAFCNTADKEILQQVLNDYDQETNDFFRWRVAYSQEEISELVKRRSGIDFGQITDLIPMLRGDSGRMIELKIVGTKRTMILGKELEIRKTFSNSHLYSSAFYIVKSESGQQITFELRGAGWGHGVGLCQIGAAVMGARGYDYRAIVAHYFRGANLEKRY